MTSSPARGGTAVLLHGAGSSGDFVRRAFEGPLAARGLVLVAPDVRRDGAGAEAHVADLAALVAEHRPVLVGGVSRGAHVAALWAAGLPPTGGAPSPAGLLLALPAWTGEPDDVARLSALAADEVSRAGVEAALAGADAAAVPWVAEELRAAWPGYGAAALVASLRAVATSPAPTVADLARVRLPVGLVALAGDPFHPRGVADVWAAALPRAALRVLDVADPARGRAVLGEAALAALVTAGGPALLG